LRAYLLIAAAVAISTLLATFLALFVAKKFELYRPVRKRDQHRTPVPRIGGIAIFIGLLVGFGLAGTLGWFEIVFDDMGTIWAIIGSAAIITVVGLLDDLVDMDWTLKLAGQVLAAGLLAWQGVQIVSLPIGGLVVGSYVFSLIMTVMVLLVVMNAVNFIDGLDGLAAGVIGIGTGTFFLYVYLLAQQTSPTNYFNTAGLLSVIVLGACIGFLPLNWRPAKIFMGDSGAMLLGLLMATSAILVTGQIDPATVTRNDLLPALFPLVLPVAILVLPLLDLLLSVFRRISQGKSPFQADAGHLHHRLQDLGHSHTVAVLVFYLWTAVISTTGLLFFFWPPTQVLVFGGLGLLAALVFTLWPVIVRRYKGVQ
jgi:UDP-GlcNAc:undecaprenyl-phosphate GlcNAc-1-phosphate transferase